MPEERLTDATAGSQGFRPMALTLTPNGVWQVVAMGVTPWGKRQLYKSPEGATCVSMLSETLENPMPPLSGLYIRFTPSPQAHAGSRLRLQHVATIVA